MCQESWLKIHFFFRCQQNTDFRVYNLKNFRCPLKVVENANYVNISVNAFNYENVYVIDKSTNEMKYIKENLFLSSLPIPGCITPFRSEIDFFKR